MTRAADQLGDQADEPAVDDEPAVASFGPTFGPETEADATRGPRRPRQPKPVEPVRRGWHPPGGMW